MKLIRQIALTTMLTIGAFSAITYTSCNKDKCKDVVCNNGGTCNTTDGSCSCKTGYEGTDCSTRANAKFVGTYSAAETCNAVNSTYQVTITADATDPTKVLVNNLGNYGCTTGGTITFNGSVNSVTLTIADNACSTQMNATGTINGNTLTITYTAVYGSPVVITDNCTATLTK